MNTRWKYRAMIVAPLAVMDAINSAIAGGLDPSGGQSTLEPVLSADGTAPATHAWCSSKLTRSGLEGLLQLAPLFPSARGYIWTDPPDDAGDAELASLFGAADNVTVGNRSPEEILVAEGLKRIEPELNHES